MEKELKAFGIKENNVEIPQMIAKGSGTEAEIIVNKAKKEGIEIIKDPSTVELLGKADMYDGIPEEAYKLVTEILLYVYKLEKEGNPE